MSSTRIVSQDNLKFILDNTREEMPISGDRTSDQIIVDALLNTVNNLAASHLRLYEAYAEERQNRVDAEGDVQAGKREIAYLDGRTLGLAEQMQSMVSQHDDTERQLRETTDELNQQRATNQAILETLLVAAIGIFNKEQ